MIEERQAQRPHTVTYVARDDWQLQLKFHFQTVAAAAAVVIIEMVGWLCARFFLLQIFHVYLLASITLDCRIQIFDIRTSTNGTDRETPKFQSKSERKT